MIVALRWLLVLWLAFMGGVAQVRSQAPPPLNDDLTITKRKAAFRVIFNFDFRRTFVDAEPVRFYGFRLGAQRGRDIVSLGFYGLGDPYLREEVQLEGVGVRDLQTRFDYAGIGYERILFDNKRWEIGAPIAIGLGNYRTSYRDLDDPDAFIAYSSNELVPVEAGVHVDYKIFWWAFIGVGGGYRYVLADDPVVTVALSDFAYYFKVGLRVGEMAKRVRKEFRKDHGSN
jgi:hypothetical protein